MHKHVLRIVPVLCVILAAGCAGPGKAPVEAAPSEPGEAAEVPEVSPPDRFEAPSGSITIDQALEAVELVNPALAAAALGLRVSEANRLQASVLPNPELSVEVEEIGGTGDESGFEAARTTVEIEQVLELGGKRAAREQVADAEARLAEWDVRVKRREVLTETRLRFVEVLAEQQQVGAAGSAFDLAGNVLRAVSERVDAGKDPPLDAIKAAGELASAEMDLAEARSGLESARLRLASMWGGESPGFDKALGELSTPEGDLPGLAQLKQALADSPALGRLADELALAQASYDAERSARISDLVVGAGVERSEAEDASTFLVSAGVELPLFNRNQGAVAAAAAMQERIQAEAGVVEFELSAMLSEAHAALRLAYERARMTENRILPAAEEAFDKAEKSYRLGKLTYLELLDTQRTLLEAKAVLAEAQAEYGRAVAQIEGLTGRSIDNLKD